MNDKLTETYGLRTGSQSIKQMSFRSKKEGRPEGRKERWINSPDEDSSKGV